MSEARITNLSNESNTGGPTISGITTFSGTNYFVPPVGDTVSRPENPEKGSIRFNTDSKYLEYYRGDTIGWVEVEASNEELNGGGRACLAGNSAGGDQIDYVTISTCANAIDFGNLTSNWGYCRGTGSSTRGIFGQTTTNVADTVEYITFASTGDAVDFGNMTQSAQSGAFTSNSTRVIAWEGMNPSTNVISYATMASTGNFVDFGDMLIASRHTCGMNSSTRGIMVGGWKADPGGNTNVIQYITTASLGNAQDFGDVTIGESLRGYAAFSNSTRGVYGGGIRHPSGVQAGIEYITMATKGNATDFGDLNYSNRQEGGGASSSTRGLFMGGYSPSSVNTIDYVEIMTTGNASDFGDLVVARAGGAASNCHGGL